MRGLHENACKLTSRTNKMGFLRNIFYIAIYEGLGSVEIMDSCLREYLITV